MNDLLAARWLFGTSLAFHIVFAAVGVAMPLFMVLAEWRFRRTGAPAYLELAKRWAKGTAILFAVGAVSGTVISFELGLLWPRFMEFAGPIIGMPFSLEGFAFFAEAIFLGIYLYGWGRVGPRLHLASGVVVAASGAASAFFVTLANAWMNVPAGFAVLHGAASDVQPLVAMFPPGWAHEVVHVLLSSYVATGFAVAGIHALFLLRDPANAFHRGALRVALGVGAVAALLQPISGDFSARQVAATQPVKLAALEGQFRTERGAPLRVGGFPDVEARETRLALEIPYGLSLLAFHDPRAEVRGLEAFPRENWPNVRNVHLAFQAMVGLGSALALVALAYLYHRLRGKPLPRLLLRAVLVTSPFGFLALEAGWLVTEWGRQPFTIRDVMRTADAVTPVGNIAVPFVAFTILYLFLAAMVIVLLRRQIAKSPPASEVGAPAPAEGAL
ncbi:MULTISPECIES: cytochrome ubiquinol oxidase subunit I [unclassified Anaeromyxobacter]|uniref:cytochrome ubiquinol oxidase subunit I n=1 Tax=unclassified Anaeromyxobacter TaxID=2620896 RepID=UPI001F5926CB|nr:MULTISPECIES: cytochrome ubiquinol oxidase subunit I [unclassified Anaeromyxobacter]